MANNKKRKNRHLSRYSGKVNYLIGTFLIFTVPSDLAYLCVCVIKNNYTYLLLTSCKTFVGLSNMADTTDVMKIGGPVYGFMEVQNSGRASQPKDMLSM